MRLQDIQSVQAAAFAAWKACPDKSRAEKARLAAELSAAAKAVAAAKRAAQPAVAVVVAAVAAVAAEPAVAIMTKEQAARLFQAAQAWPRCGQAWPTGDVEEEAAALMVGLNECGRTPLEEEALEAAFAASIARKNAAEVERQKTRAQLLSSSAPAEKSSKTLAAFAALVPQLTRDEAVEVGFDSIAIFCAEKVDRYVVVNRHGHILSKNRSTT